MNLINSLNNENPEISITDELLFSVVWSALVDSGASIVAIPEDKASLLEEKGLEIFESLIMGILIKPIITEKATLASERYNRYTFLVNTKS